MVGIVTTHLQAYEYGTRHPKEEILDRLALALEVVPSMLQPLDVDTVEGLLGIIYEMHTSYHGLEIVEDEDGRVSIRLPDTLQAMPAKKSLLRIKHILDQSTRNLPEPEYQSEEQLAEDAEILPDTGVTVGQERRWYKEHEGLLMHAIAQIKHRSKKAKQKPKISIARIFPYERSSNQPFYGQLVSERESA